MDELERCRSLQQARQAALSRLGAKNVRCLCGCDDPIAFEPDHIYRRMYDGTCWGLCKTCHAIKSARERIWHPPVGLYPGDPFERMAHRCWGIAEYLLFCSEGLRADADMLFKLAGKGFEIKD